MKRNEFTGKPIKVEKRIEKEEKHKRHQEKVGMICENPKRYHVSGVYLETEKYVPGEGIEKLEKPYYKNYYRNSRISGFYKKKCNRKVRHYRGPVANGGMYKRIDFYRNALY